MNSDSPIDFIFGSNRKYIDFGPIDFGTKSGDIIFKSMADQEDIQFVLNVGNKVYYDPTGKLQRKESLKDMRELNRKVFNCYWQRKLYKHIPGYDICDDRDLHMVNAGQKTRSYYPYSYINGMKAYREYQHYLGPKESAGKPLYYSFERNGAHFFVLDVRSRRMEFNANPTIISPNQQTDFIYWITDPAKRDKYKFIISPVCIVSKTDKDSWSGFPKQQLKIIETILGNDLDGEPINKVVLLVGGAHCSRLGVYDVYDNDGKLLGNLTEIISSNLVVTDYDKGKPFTEFIEISGYDDNNDFPHTIDHTYDGGLKFVTRMASLCFPNAPVQHTFSNKIVSNFRRIADNSFIRITEHEGTILVRIINQNNVELYKLTLKL